MDLKEWVIALNNATKITVCGDFCIHTVVMFGVFFVISHPFANKNDKPGLNPQISNLRAFATSVRR